MPTQPADVPADGLPRLGDVLDGKFEIVAVLGRGGMGIVYEGVQHAGPVRRKVAVKFVRPESAAVRGVLERFVREAEVCAQLSHPNVVEIYDFGTHGSAAYMVMPLLRGESLAHRLEREVTLPLDLALRLMTEVLRGLHAAHEAGVIHRDVKPDNIFLVEGPEGPTAKVLDFGIAKVAASEEVPALTREGAILGTPSYMSPEQASGDPDLDRATDLYSVGAALYHALTGRKPFVAASLPALFVAIRQGGCAPVSHHRPDLPAALSEVVAQAMALDPARRFASAPAFIAALQRCSPAGEGEAPRPPVAGPPPRVEGLPEAVIARWSSTFSRTGLRAPVVGLALLSVGAGVALARMASDGGTSPRGSALAGGATVVAAPATGRPVHPAVVTTRSAAPVARAEPSDAGAPARSTEPAAPHAPPSPGDAAATFQLLVRTEDEAVVSVPGAEGRVVARVRRPGEQARAVLRAPAGARTVCCKIPYEDDPTCVVIQMDGRAQGHADCFAR